MSDYIKTTDFAAKDALLTGNPNKIASGTQVDTEFNNIATAVASKLDESGGTITGSLTIDTNLTVSGTLSVNGDLTTDNNSAAEVGYKGIPFNAQTGNYTLVLTDNGKAIYHASGAGSGDTYTIPANSSVAFPIGTVIAFINDDTTNSVSIAINTDTQRLSGTTLTGTRTLIAGGMAFWVKTTSTTWICSGDLS